MKPALLIALLSKRNGAAELVTVLSHFAKSSFAIDDANIYWTDETRGTVMRIKKQ